jgi:hypothetical protein
MYPSWKSVANLISAAEISVVDVVSFLNRPGILRIASNCRWGSFERIPERGEIVN